MVAVRRDPSGPEKRAVIVGDAMSRDPVTIGPDAGVAAAAALMRARSVRHLPVVGDAGQLLGILTDRDLEHAAFVPALAEAMAWEPRWLKAPRVRDVMTWRALTTQRHVPLLQAALVMFQHRIGSLPVVDDGRLVGILTGRSVLAALEATKPCSGTPVTEDATWTSRTS
jgi:acetoin utilization protein AcuB